MKLGLENKRQTGIAVVLLLVAAFALWNWLHSGDENAPPAPSAAATPTAKPVSSSSSKKAGKQPVAQSLDPTLQLAVLKSSEDVTYKGAGRDIFQNQPEPVAIPKTVTPVIQTGPPPPPPPPPIPLKFYGFADTKGSGKQVFLSKGDDIFVAKEGQVIDRRYKILKISPMSVEVEDVMTNHRQTLPLTAG